MAYNKKEWSLTTPITPEELNRMEQGIADNDKSITNHKNDFENPHNVTAEQIDTYTKNVIDNKVATVQSALTTHVNNTENPHNVTATQVGTYDKDTIDSKVSVVENNLDTHKNDKNNPHGVTAEQVGAYTKEETDNKFVDKVTYTQDKQELEQSIDDIKEQIDEPSFIDLTIDEPVYHIEEATLDSPKEIQVIEGSTIEVDGQLLPVKNPVIESVGRNLFDWEHILRNNPTVSRTTYNGRDCLSWRAGPETENHRFLRGKFKPNTQYTISGYFAVSTGSTGSAYLCIVYTDGSYDRKGTSSTTFEYFTITSRPGKTVDYLSGQYNANQLVYLDINTTMLNEGTTPLPYEPFRSTKLAINGEYHQWDKIINDGGVYYDEIGSGKITFDGSEDWRIENYEGRIYFYILNDYFPDRISHFDSTNLKAMISDNLLPYADKGSSLPVYWTTSDAGFFEIYIESVDTLEQLEQYLSQNPLTVVYQLATPTRKPTFVIEAGDPDFSQGNTIYLHSDTEAIPTVHAKVAVDIAAQVNNLTKDSYEKGKKIHELEVKITDDITDLKQDVDQNTSDIAEIQDNINTLNTEVSGINQSITDLETDIQNTFVDTTYTISNGHLTFYRKDGTTKVLDLPLEMIIESGRFDEETNTIILTMANQQTIEIPVGAVVTDISETLHNVKDKLNQLQTDVSQVQENVTNIQNELNKKITLNSSYGGTKKEYEIGTIFPVYTTTSFIEVGEPRKITPLVYNGLLIGFEEADPNDTITVLKGTWVCIGRCGQNYYLFQRVE